MDEPARADVALSPAARLLRPSGVVAVAVMASIAARSLSERLSDPDLWWHLRTGELIATTRSIPRTDVYSYTAEGQPWTVQEWGSELILHWLREVFGLWGILGYRTVLLVAIYAVMARIILRHVRGGMGAWALVALAAYAGAANWTERPNLLSFLLFAVFLDVLDARRPRAVWWLVPLTALWANLHGMVIVGLGLLFVFAAGESLAAARDEQADRSWPRALWLVLLASFAASMLNPRGFGLYTHAFGLLDTVQDVVTEWASPDFHQAGTWPFLALMLLTFVVLILAARRPHPTDLLLVLAFTFLALQAARNLAMAGIVLGVVFARNAGAAGRTLGFERAPERPPSVPLGFAGILIVLIALGSVVAEGLPASGADRDLIDETYPIGAIDALDRPGVRVLAYDVWATLVIDRAWPNARVFFDLRSDMYGIEGVARYQRTIAALPDWEENLDETCTTHVLIRETDPLNQVLTLTDGWEVEAADDLSVTWVRAAQAEGCEDVPVPRASL